VRVTEKREARFQTWQQRRDMGGFDQILVFVERRSVDQLERMSLREV